MPRAPQTPEEWDLVLRYLANGPEYGGSLPTLEQVATSGPQPPGRMRPELARALLADQPGIEAELTPPTGIGDLAMEPVVSFLDEAGVAKYLPFGMAAMFMGPKALRKAKALTGKDVLREAANKKSAFPGFAAWRKTNPEAGAGLFDMSDLKPAIPGYPQQPVYTPKFGPSERSVAAMTNPRVRETLKGLVSHGMDVMKEPWYRTHPLYKVFQEEWGPLADEKFIRHMQEIAGTSPGMSVPNNIRTGSYYWYLLNQELPVPAKYVTKVNPRTGKRMRVLEASPAGGYGAKTQDLHAANALDLRAGGIDPIERPKNPRFAGNLIGQEEDVTIDTHNMRMIGMVSRDPRWLATQVTDQIKLPNGKIKKVTVRPREMFDRGKITIDEALDHPTWWESAPKPNEYGYLQEQQRGLAKEMEPVAQAKLGRPLMPAEWQDKAWVGAGLKSDLFPGTGLESPPEAWLQTLAARVHYTADRMAARGFQITPQEVLRKYIRGEIPLLAIPLAGVLGVSQSEERPPAAPPGLF